MLRELRQFEAAARREIHRFRNDRQKQVNDLERHQLESQARRIQGAWQPCACGRVRHDPVYYRGHQIGLIQVREVGSRTEILTIHEQEGKTSAGTRQGVNLVWLINHAEKDAWTATNIERGRTLRESRKPIDSVRRLAQ